MGLQTVRLAEGTSKSQSGLEVVPCQWFVSVVELAPCVTEARRVFAACGSETVTEDEQPRVDPSQRVVTGAHGSW